MGSGGRDRPKRPPGGDLYWLQGAQLGPISDAHIRIDWSSSCRARAEPWVRLSTPSHNVFTIERDVIDDRSNHCTVDREVQCAVVSSSSSGESELTNSGGGGGPRKVGPSRQRHAKVLVSIRCTPLCTAGCTPARLTPSDISGPKWRGSAACFEATSRLSLERSGTAVPAGRCLSNPARLASLRGVSVRRGPTIKTAIR
jgi:hypothetical protein